ncbi:unnamed protein product [Spirodela intermedia]|uniref:Uncharacterized protein n=1 Tax=Spirodela intermedia TaxID=51605 RepID=A0A7I8ITC8_SPIIN|nr:unnamed protein product [Spirodela intermedia]CAA6661262.1 unnamed protein product [Spirodela intermedia]
MVPSLFPREDDDDGDGESSGASEWDDALDDDMETLRRACVIAGRRPTDIDRYSGGEGSDSEDDLDLLRSIQERFPLPSTAGSPPILKALNSIPSIESDEEDDFETLRAIQRRFVQYEDDSRKERNVKNSFQALQGVPSAIAEREFSNHVLESRNGESLSQENGDSVVPKPCEPTSLQQSEDRSGHLSSRISMYSRFPVCAQTFVDALKRNRSCQRLIRAKLIDIEAKIERNKELKRRAKCLMDFQVVSGKRMNQVFCQKRDPRVRLISLPKQRLSFSSKESARKTLPLRYGPRENPHVSAYRMVLSNFPFSSHKQRWLNTEKENLAKGIKQQYQERVLLTTMELSSDLAGSLEDSAAIVRKNFEFSPENIRSFLPMINWERLASMYLPGRSGAECEARWLNCEDPLINHNPWTTHEEKKLLHIVQTKGIYNWIDIAISLATHRTPFQCLVRYQRSLNPCILKKDWTEGEDSQLRAAVETFGEDNWQLVASYMEGRTGPQCSNRWRKSLHPSRRKVGRWSVDEDKRLKVAVILFGAKNWNKIAQFTPGRTQVQCRERWVNCLDPSLNLEEWTEEEDTKLKEAIATYGYCWSKVASSVPPRTDSQCRRRWKVLFPDEVPLRKAAWKVQKAVLVSNFVDRESERPLISPSDFCIASSADVNLNSDGTRRRRRRSKTENLIGSSLSNAPKRVSSQRHKAKDGISKETISGGNQAGHRGPRTVSKKSKKALGQQNEKSDKVTEPEGINDKDMLSSCDAGHLGAAAAGTSLEVASASFDAPQISSSRGQNDDGLSLPPSNAPKRLRSQRCKAKDGISKKIANGGNPAGHVGPKTVPKNRRKGLGKRNAKFFIPLVFPLDMFVWLLSSSSDKNRI